MTEIIIANTKKESNELQQVVSGDVFDAYVESKKATEFKPGLSEMGAYNLRTSTLDILNHCNPHDGVKNKETTHLVVGYVQSGKTMSFAGVLAMARDNGYRFAVVLTGVTTNLKNQTFKRLNKDLNLSSSEDYFKIIANPNVDYISSIIKSYRLSDKPMIIFPILKHTKYIDDIANLFASDKIKNLITNETVLIIDDEADQASLNSFGYKNSKILDPNEKPDQSAIYSSILRMRNQLPGNSYIQYTATPQANILIAMSDLLSPKSHTLLEPGEDYIGGKKFFGQEKDGSLFNGGLIQTIKEEEVYHKKNNALTKMPASLREALMMHVWAVVLVIKWYKRPLINHLSMMVHPTDIIEGNKIFQKWIKDETDLWSNCLAKPVHHEDRFNLMNKFKEIFPQAIQYYPLEGRPSFDDVSKYIPDVINDSEIYRITGESDDDPTDIKWDSHKMNILIGAQMLNRGFTVENLAITYMPRYTTGITNADTIEQRCRFFGYKKDYIESCRVYLPKKTIDDYISYIKHEEELRVVLGKSNSFKEYERAIMLSPRLRPTRQNVLPKDIVKNKLSGWCKFDRLVLGKMITDNKQSVSSFVNKHIKDASDFITPCYNTSDYDDKDVKKHIAKQIPCSEVIDLLKNYTAGNLKETLIKSMTVRYLNYLSTLDNITIDVIFMSCDRERQRKYTDKTENNSQIKEYEVALFQGRSKMDSDENYCGDGNIKSDDRITLQIHHLFLKHLPLSIAQYSDTYMFAINFPEKYATMYNNNVSKD